MWKTSANSKQSYTFWMDGEKERQKKLYSELPRISPFLCMRPFVNHCFVAPVHLKFTIDTFFSSQTIYTHIVTLSRLLSLYFRFRSDFIHHAFYLNFIHFLYVCPSLSLRFSFTLDSKWLCAIVSIVWTHCCTRNRKCETMGTKWNSFFLVPRRDKNCRAARRDSAQKKNREGVKAGNPGMRVWSVRKILHRYLS